MSVLPVIDLGEEKACFFIIIGCQPTTPTHGLFMGSSLFCHDEASVEHFYEGAGAVERELSITCSFRQALFYLLSSVSFLFRLQPTGRRQTMLLSCKLKYIPKKIRREHGSTGGGGGNGPSPPPLVLGHFVKDFTKTVIFLNIRPPPQCPLLNFSVRPIKIVSSLSAFQGQIKELGKKYTSFILKRLLYY